mgnify:CR=1 FL=1
MVNQFDQYPTREGIVFESEYNLRQHIEGLAAENGMQFDEEDVNLLVNYAKAFEDMDAVRTSIRELKSAVINHNDDMAQEVRDYLKEEIASLPDQSIGIYDMHRYGYHGSGVLPLTRKRAIELYSADLTVYSLNESGSRTLMMSKQDIMKHVGIFCVDTKEWESYRLIEKIDQRKTMNDQSVLMKLDQSKKKIKQQRTRTDKKSQSWTL